jgi:hypothetical protein
MVARGERWRSFFAVAGIDRGNNRGGDDGVTTDDSCLLEAIRCDNQVLVGLLDARGYKVGTETRLRIDDIFFVFYCPMSLAS